MDVTLAVFVSCQQLLGLLVRQLLSCLSNRLTTQHNIFSAVFANLKFLKDYRNCNMCEWMKTITRHWRPTSMSDSFQERNCFNFGPSLYKQRSQRLSFCNTEKNCTVQREWRTHIETELIPKWTPALEEPTFDSQQISYLYNTAYMLNDLHSEVFLISP